jgi:membrane fusion protein (multidrug efflux system)
MKRAWGVGAFAVVIALLVLARVTILRGDSSTRTPRAGGSGGGPTLVEIHVVGAAPMTDRVSAIGTLRPNEEVQIRSELSGRVDTLAFREGTRVARGDLLLKINDEELRARLALATARLAIAKEEAGRQERLFADSLTSARDLNNALNETAAAEAEAALIRAQLGKAEIRAPFDGVVGLRSISEGTYVTPATPIASLHDHTPVKIEFAVPERHAARIHVGDEITFTVDGIRETFRGTIYAREAAIDPVTRALRLRAESPNVDGRLIPGAFANVEIVFAERTAVTVPPLAVIPQLKGHRVFVLRAGKAESRSVEIGTRTDESVEILRGLAPGDTLITSGILQLKDGAEVRFGGQ